MKTTKLHLDELHKTFNVTHKHRQVMSANLFWLHLLQQDAPDEDLSDVELQVQTIKFGQECVDFPVNMLNLDEKEQKVLEDMDEDALQLLDMKIMMAVQGASKQKIDKAILKMQDAQKSISDADAD